MDNATKRQLKQQDQFVKATENSLEWVSNNRRSAIVSGAVILAVILLAVGGYTLFQYRTNQASAAFGQAMQVYQTPVASAEQPVPPGTKTFPDVKTRAAAANGQFLAAADRFGMTEPGKLALYFAGLTYMEEGQSGPAEATLQKVAGSWNGSLAALAKLSLAQIYQQTGRDAQAVTLYNELAKKNASTVPSGLAQIQLGEMYQAQGKVEQARKIFAQVKDKDKGPKGQLGPAGELASEKLNPQAAAGPEAGPGQ